MVEGPGEGAVRRGEAGRRGEMAKPSAAVRCFGGKELVAGGGGEATRVHIRAFCRGCVFSFLFFRSKQHARSWPPVPQWQGGWPSSRLVRVGVHLLQPLTQLVWLLSATPLLLLPCR